MASNLNLRQLQHIVLLAEESHFGRAAARACLSQPAFSRSVAALEESIGMRLFDRGPGYVRLTSSGIQVMARARRLLSSSVDLSRELDLLRSGELGDITVGSGPFSGPTLMASAIAQMQATHPSVKVRLEIGSPLALYHLLLNEKLDFFMADLSELAGQPQCRVESLGVGLGCLYVRREHPLAAQEQVTLSEVRRHPLISVHVPAPLSRKLGKILGSDETGLLSLAMECESALVLREYALQNDAVLLAPQSVFTLDVTANLLRRLHVAELDGPGGRTPLCMHLGLIWLQDRTPSVAAEILAKSVRQVASAMLLRERPHELGS